MYWKTINIVNIHHHSYKFFVWWGPVRLLIATCILHFDIQISNHYVQQHDKAISAIIEPNKFQLISYGLGPFQKCNLLVPKEALCFSDPWSLKKWGPIWLALELISLLEQNCSSRQFCGPMRCPFWFKSLKQSIPH